MEDLHGGVVSSGLAGVLTGLDAYLSDVAAGLHETLSDADVLDELRAHELLARRLQRVSHSLVGQLERRSIPGRLLMSSSSAVLQAMFRLSPYDASQRVRAAQECGARRAMNGERLEPLRPTLAAAQANGEVSADQTRAILRALRRLPVAASAAEIDLAEDHLVQAAATLPPRQLGVLGERIRDYLDPDGAKPSDAEQDRLRELFLYPEPDGSYRIRGRLTPTCGAMVMAVLMAQSAPKPAAEAADDADALIPDARTFPQRLHDALEEMATSVVGRNDVLPSGASTQLIITVSEETLSSGSGFAETSYGQLLTVDQALRMADESEIAIAGRTANGSILTLGRTRRIASKSQTLALIARDKGCSFPDCNAPPGWCQRHHILAWILGGLTNILNLTLLCPWHHRMFAAAGWRCQMIDGLPHWIPPSWVDPERRPRLNPRIGLRASGGR